MPTAHLTKSKSLRRKEAKEQQELDELRDSVLGSLLGPKPQLPTPQEILAVGRQEVSARAESFYHDRLAHYAYALHHRPTGARVQFASAAKDAGAVGGGDEDAGDQEEDGLLLEYMSVAGRWQEVSLLTEESDPGIAGGVAAMQPVDDVEGPAPRAGPSGNGGGGAPGREQDAAEREGQPMPRLLDQLLGAPDAGAAFASRRRRESLAATAGGGRAGGWRRSLDEGSRIPSGAGFCRGLNSSNSSTNYISRPGLPSSGTMPMLLSNSGETPGAPGAPPPPPLSGSESSVASVSSGITYGGLAGVAGSRHRSNTAVSMPRASSLRPATARLVAGGQWQGQSYGAAAGSAASHELRRSVDPSPHEGDALAVTTPTSAAGSAGAGAGASTSGVMARRASFSLGPASASQLSMFGGGLSSYGAAAAADPSPHPPVCLAGLPAAAFHGPHPPPQPHPRPHRASTSAAMGALATTSASVAAAAENNGNASLTAMRSAWQLADAAHSARSLGAAARAGGSSLAPALVGSPAPPAAASAPQAATSTSGLSVQDGLGLVGGVDGGNGNLGAAGQAAWALAAAASTPPPLPMPSAPLRCVPRTASCTAVIPSGGSGASGMGSTGGAAGGAARDAWFQAREAAAASLQQRQRQEAHPKDEEAYHTNESEEQEDEEGDEEGEDHSQPGEEDARGEASGASAAAGPKKKKKKGTGGRLLEEGGKAVESSWRSFSAGVTALRAAAALSMGGIVGRTSMRFGRAVAADPASVAGGEAATGMAAGGPVVGPGSLMLSRRQRRASNVILPYPDEHTSALAGPYAGAGDGDGNPGGAGAAGNAAACSPPGKGAAHTPQAAQLAAMLDTIRPASLAPPSSVSPVASSKGSPTPARGHALVARVPSFLSRPGPPGPGQVSAGTAAAAAAAAAGRLAPMPRHANRRASLDETWLGASLQQERAAAAPPPHPPRRGSLEITRSAASAVSMAAAWEPRPFSNAAAPAMTAAGPTSPTSSQSQPSFLRRAAAGGGSPVPSPVAAATAMAAPASAPLPGAGVKSQTTGSKLGAFDRLVHSLSHVLHKPGSKRH